MSKIKIKPISPKFKLLYQKARFKILYGGRGSGKSYAVAEALIYYACNYGIRILCCREIQKSIADSSYAMIVQMIKDLKLDEEFYITKNSIQHKTTGAEFIFAGLRSNVTSIQSIHNISICWIEEAQSISEASWRVLTPSIRAKGSEIWATLNPFLPTDIIAKNFIERSHPDAKTIRINYTDNIKCPDVLIGEAVDMKLNDHEMYEHVWLGGYMKQGSNNLFKFGDLLNAQTRIGVAKDDGVVVAGFDVARFGDDKSALIIRNHGKILYSAKYEKQEIFTTCSQVLEKLYEYNVNRVVVDATGLGAGAVEKLKELNTRISLTVVEYNSSYKAEKAKLLNARCEVYTELSKWVKDNDSGIPADMDDLVEELSVVRYDFAKSSDKMKIVDKDEMKKVIGRSPDISDALSMTFYQHNTNKSAADSAALKKKLFG